MRYKLQAVCFVITALLTSGLAPTVLAGMVPITNWAKLVGTSTVTNANTNSPTFTPASAIQVAGGFPTVTLADGDFVTVAATVTMARAGTGTFGDGFRFALMGEVGGGNPTTDDGTGYTGISVALQNAMREHRNPGRAQPFSSGGAGAPLVVIDPAGADPEGNTVSGANVTLNVLMTIKRDGNAIDIVGSIDNGGNYTQAFNVNDRVLDTAFTTDVYSFNRMAFLFAAGVNGTSATVSNARVRSNLIIPEPASGILLVVAMAGLVAANRTRSRWMTIGS